MAKHKKHQKHRKFEAGGIRLKDRYQLLIDMSGLMSRMKMSAADFDAQYKITKGQVNRLRDDTWVQVEREDLLLLANLARKESGHEFIKVIEDEIWTTFDASTCGFPGVGLEGKSIKGDRGILDRFEAGTDFVADDARPPVLEAMRTYNCLFVGSPKTNAKTEECLKALWPSEDPPPLRFFWPAWPNGRKQTDFARRGEKKRVEYANHEGKRVSTVDEISHPAGALVICRSPLKTLDRVTTIVIAGCTKAGTQRIADDLLSGAVFVPPSQLEPGIPSIFILGRPTQNVAGWYNIQREIERTKRASAGAQIDA